MLFTQKVTEAIAHRHLFHTEAFTRRDRYKLQLPQTDAFTLHTKAFTQKKLLRTDAATRGHFSTQRPCYTTKFWHREALTYRSFCSQTSWHTEAFTHAQSSFTDRRTFFTEKLLETWKAFTTTPYKVTRRQKKWLAFPTRTISTEGCAREEQNLSHFITHCLGFCLMTMNVELAVAWFPISRLHAGWGHMAQSAGSERWPTTIENTAQLEKHVVQTEIAGTSGKRPFLIS